MQELKIFRSKEFGEIRTLLEKNGKVLFCASDVAKALGYTKPSTTVTRHCKNTVVKKISTNGGDQAVKFIFEPDLYRLVMKSKLPTAEKFENWVFTSLLPTIHQKDIPFNESDIESILEKPNTLKLLLRLTTDALHERTLLKQEIAELRKKEQLLEKLMATESEECLSLTAKQLQINPHSFTQYLLNRKYIYRDCWGKYLPMQKYVAQGYFRVVNASEDNDFMKQTVVTREGEIFFMQQRIDEKIDIPDCSPLF